MRHWPPTIRLFLVPSINRSKVEWLEGYTEQPGSRTICADLPNARMNVVRLLVHEVIHVQHPSWSECRVVQETRKVYNKMTWKAKANFLKEALAVARIGYPPKEEDENA
jgi:hypothetical protein